MLRSGQMFGFLVYNDADLTDQQRDEYKRYYCGLCYQLKNDFGMRRTLTYDLNFVHILLSSINQTNDTVSQLNCPLHPFRKQEYIVNEFTPYCAAMNNLLFYFKMLDDANDDGNRRAARFAEKMKPQIDRIALQYPQHYEVTQRVLHDITQMEKDNVLNPDLPANAFGTLMGQLFITGERDEHLFNFGFHLGRYIYLADAMIDLKADIKAQRYNPLIRSDSSSFEDILMMVMQQCADEYEKLPITRNKELLDNIIYSGIWIPFRSNQKGKMPK